MWVPKMVVPAKGGFCISLRVIPASACAFEVVSEQTLRKQKELAESALKSEVAIKRRGFSSGT